MEARIAPSVPAKTAIERLLLAELDPDEGADEVDRLTSLGPLGAQLVLRQAIEEELATFLRRARYERTPEARGSRNGPRSRQIATAEGPLAIAALQVRDSLTCFVSTVIPDCRSVVRTKRSMEPLARRTPRAACVPWWAS